MGMAVLALVLAWAIFHDRMTKRCSQCSANFLSAKNSKQNGPAMQVDGKVFKVRAYKTSDWTWPKAFCEDCYEPAGSPQAA